MTALCRTIGLVVLTAATCSVQAVEVTIDSRHFTLPDGFTIEKVAGPPLVNRPITADLDEAGHLYVADSSGSSEKTSVQLLKKPHRIVRLTDTKGDGHFDAATIFADKMMFPEGTLWLNGSLFVAAPPSIWKLTDTTGTGVADKRIEWFAGKTLTGCANDLHGPYLGPDGWVYWCKGAFAEQTYEVPGRKPFITRAAHLFRARPDGTGIEPVMTGGMDNPIEIAFTPGGERIFSCTFLQQPAGGKRDGLIHAIYGGIYGKVHDVIDGHAHTFPEVMPVLVNTGPAAECALTRYEGDAFGAEYRDNLFASSFNLHKVTRHVLKPQGATFVSSDSDFLVCDSLDFHPTHLVEDADGSLLIVDTGGWYKLCCPTSQLGKPDVLGAIYRVKRVDAKPPEDPRGLKLAWETMSSAELCGFLDDSRFAVRKRAIAALAKRGHEALVSLTEVKSSVGRINAVWAATRIDDVRAREICRALLQDGDETVRQAAAHSASVWRDPEAVAKLLQLLTGSSAHNRRVAAEALGRIGDPRAVGPLLAALENPGDHVLEHSLTYALIQIGDANGTRAGLASANPHVRRAAMMALDQMDPPGELEADIVARELISPDAPLRDTAAWIAVRHPEWGDALAGVMKMRLRATSWAGDERAQLRHQLSKLAAAPGIQSLLAESLRASGEQRFIALAAIGECGLKPMPAAWADGIVAILSRDDGASIRAAAAAIHRMPVASAGPFAAPLLAAASRPELAAEVRLDALSAIPGQLKRVAPELFSFILSQLSSEQPASRRSLALEVLGRSDLSHDQCMALVPAIKSAGPLEINALWAAIMAAGDELVAVEAIASLHEAKSLKSLRADQIRTALAKFGPGVKKDAEDLIVKLNPDAAEQKARLDSVMASLPVGDVRRGQVVFNSTKAACVSCHAIGYVGGHVGPDLTRVGGIRSKRDLMESIFYPSASFAQSFEPYTAITKGDQRYDGILRRNDAEEVMLFTGPDQEIHIPRGELKELRPGTLSIMPAGLEQQLSTQDLADLVAFLEACR